MKIWGKVIGAILGFAAGGGPFGAILGMMAGHAYDQRLAEQSNRQNGNNRNAQQQAAFNQGVIILGAKMSKVDGRVTRAKIDAFKRVFNIQPKDEAYVGRVFDNARRSAEGFEPYAFSLAQTFVSQPMVLEEILSGLFQIAAVDGATISPAEADFLRQVSFTFNFTPDDFSRIAIRAGVKLPTAEQAREARREVKRDMAGDPFHILGITEQAKNDEIKTAYRNLIRKHHPDKLAAEGLPADQIAVANEKMKRINVAYDSICKVRGIK